MKKTTKRLLFIENAFAQIKKFYRWCVQHSSKLAVPLRCYIVMFLIILITLVIMCICKANDAGSVLINIFCSLLASVVYAFITDIAATIRMNKKMEKQYQSLLLPLIISVECFYADMVAINSRLDSKQICKRNFEEWVDFFTAHYCDEGIYDQYIIDDMLDILSKIEDQANNLRQISIMHFDHEMLGTSKQSSFRNLAFVAHEVAEFLENKNIDSAMKLVKGRFKDIVLRVYPEAPFDRKVDCTDGL